MRRRDFFKALLAPVVLGPLAVAKLLEPEQVNAAPTVEHLSGIGAASLDGGSFNSKTGCAMAADWDAGSFKVRSYTFCSDAQTGVAPC